MKCIYFLTGCAVLSIYWWSGDGIIFLCNNLASDVNDFQCYDQVVTYLINKFEIDTSKWTKTLCKELILCTYYCCRAGQIVLGIQHSSCV